MPRHRPVAVLPLALAFTASLPLSAASAAGAPQSSAPSSLQQFLARDGRFDLERARRAGFSGAVDSRGFEVRIDRASGAPSFAPLPPSRIVPPRSGFVPVPPRPDDSNWWDGFGLPSVNNHVTCVIVYHGDLYAAGPFTQMGGTFVNNIARWDGTRWNDVGGGTRGAIFSMAIFRDRLIVGGELGQVGRNYLGAIAQWDGLTWSPLGSLIGGTAYSLAVTDSELIAGGNLYLNAGGASSVARSDGTTWTAVGPSFDFPAFAVAVYQNEIIAGGYFTHAGDSPLRSIARWDGQGWTSLGGGVAAAQNILGAVYALTVDHGELLAGGQFDTAGTVPARSIARWNGTAWDSIPGTPSTPYSDAVLGFGFDGSTLVIGGLFFDLYTPHSIASWDGSRLRLTYDGLEYEASSFALYQDRLVVSGPFGLAGGEPHVGIASWNGSTWEGFETWQPSMRGLLSPYYSGSVYALAVYHGDLYAGGDFSYAGDPPGWTACQGLARWDGSRWWPVAHASYWQVHALRVFNDALIVGGWLDPYPVFQGLARWDGTNLESLGNGPGNGIFALAEFAGQLYAGGTMSGGIARWDGQTWSLVGGGLSDTSYYQPQVYALEAHGGGLFVGGAFSMAGGSQAANLARWDGAAWSQVGGGVDGVVFALKEFGTDLIVGGDFVAREDAMVSTLARWDGSSLRSIAAADGSQVWAIGTYGRDLIVGGALYSIDGLSVGNIARMSRSGWGALGSGTDNTVHALAENDGSLYVGGAFTAAGGKSSFHVARWDGGASFHRLRALAQLENVTPNPASRDVQLSFRLQNAGPVELAIYDLRGRRVETLLNAEQSAGPHQAVWRARGAGTQTPVPPGLYFARLTSTGTVSTRKIAVIP